VAFTTYENSSGFSITVTTTDKYTFTLGATPSMIREWTLGAYELTAGSTDEGIKRLLRNVPVIGLFGMNRDLEYMFRTRY